MRAEILREQQGLSLNEALRRRWHGPRFHTAHHVRVRRSLPGLRARYYRWRRNGRTAEGIAVRYISTLPPVPPEAVGAFVAACAVAGVTHFSQALRLTDSKGFSFHRVLAALPDQALRIIRETFAARRKAEIERRKLVKQSQGKLHRLLAADAARGRKLKRLAKTFIGSRGVSGVDSTSGSAKAPVQGRKGPLQADFKGVANGSGPGISGE